ncbi:MAG: glycerol-3-phosphate acyltransferase [Clostridia bacterium]|nr:glycerol-3-phosphate acyltransferase [Clostridia bacterium]
MYLDELSKFIIGLPRLFIKLGLAEVRLVEEVETFHPMNTAVQALYLVCLLLGFAILPYLIGSISIPRLYCRRFAKLDLCTLGSQKGEIGDVWRFVGKGHAIACFALELVKVIFCLALGFFCRGADGAAIAASFCVIGEIMPVWNKMRGTRGFETAALCTLVLSPLVFAILLLIFAIVLIGMRFRTAARIFPTLLYPLIASAFLMNANPTAVLLSVGVVALMLFSHWKNIRAMMEREEPRLEFKKNKSEEED